MIELFCICKTFCSSLPSKQAINGHSLVVLRGSQGLAHSRFFKAHALMRNAVCVYVCVWVCASV